ncbi:MULTISPECIES: hypothetical protein [Mycolicibacterium]|uniref:Uncharacterized protein n=1 Tax=Mycolicibacterium austroafricanum TaxID=39687 RepID=A0ABT8HBP0_MYCAO|nr:hypothetical protein [Mycolicibacterium austroafricanum]MDN4518134.1 hypothetical protein [Mycolicibacterium austroafricanum]PQP47500.1 hypothetical protein C6A88_15855 [Mycolicibacterium austroafricanum]QRZ08673.1 hypothetical protein JN090_09275 [Mycolicibacterium austroafricanum]QZT70323.1 hypothetical protein JN086_10210 [Mycolicibacterium austroafricanum]QZY48124.1 hypothetical protein K5L12_10715 [Mycolicibacterium austroafricanum]
MNTHLAPRDAAEAVTAHPVLPAGDDERFVGFGIMGLPFAGGHYLALRQFPATTFAPAYVSVWHRDPACTWTFYATTPGQQSCARYFSSATPNDAVQCDIDVTWQSSWSVHIEIPKLLQWTVQLQNTWATRLMTSIGTRLPEAAWTNPATLSMISRVAGPTLGAGDIRLTGTAANGQRYMVAPKTVWAVAASRAMLRGEDLGPIGPLMRQARLGDFRLPQRGIGVIGSGHFENYDADRHRAAERTVAFG